MFLAKFGIKNPITVFMIFIAVVVLGFISLTKLSIDLYPDISYPMAVAITQYKGAGPAEVESMVSRPLERVISSVTNVKNVTSSSMSEMSAVMVEFNWGTNMDVASANIREKIDLIKQALPKDMDNPIIIKFDPSLMPVMMLSLNGPKGLAELRTLAEDIVQPGLERIEGVASASVSGGLQREIHLDLNRSRVESFGLSIQQIMGAVGASNLNLPGGNVVEGQTDFVVRTTGQFTEVKQLENVVVGNQQGVPIYLKDIAEIKDDFADQTGVSRINSAPTVMLQVQKASGSNTVQVARRVKQKLEDIRKQLPAGCNLTMIMDTSVFIEDAIKNVQKSAVEGAVLAIFIILIFLRSLRSTFIISLAIPISVITTFVLLYFGKLTLNIATLGGLALGIGRLVDDAIVVLENIYRHMQQGEPPNEASVLGASEVGMAVVASTITTIVVFVPMLFVTGIAGMLFTPMAYTVSFSLIASLFVALMLIPVLTSKFLRVKPSYSPFFKKLEHFFDEVDNQYGRLIEWSLKHKKTVIYGTIGLFILSLAIVPLVGTEFMPSSDEGQFSISIKLPVGTKIETTSDVLSKIENIIAANVPEVENIQARGGVEGKGIAAMANIFTGISGSHAASVRVSLVPLSKRHRSTDEIAESLRPLLAKIPGAEIKFSAGGFMSGGGAMFGGAPVQVEIRGYDIDTGQELANKIADILRNIKGAKDVTVSREAGLPELQIQVNRERAASLGLSVAQIASVIRTSLEGTVASIYRDPQLGKEFSIVVRLRENDRKSLSDLSRVFITSPTGKQVPLSNLVTINKAAGPVKIDRKNQVRIITVSSQIFGRPSGTISQELKQKIDKNIVVPQNFSVEVTGSFKEQRDAFLNLALAFLLAIALIYIVLASQFESLIDPFIIMFSVPLGIIGVIWGLFLTGHTISAVSLIGVLMMAGIVVSNGILLVDFTNILRKRGTELHQAVIKAGHTRLRPILMTTLATVLGMIPLALGVGEGAETEAPMAVSVISGLTMSTVLTLVFVPTLYTVIEERIKRRAK